SILAMAQANQIPVTQVFEVDASRQTTRVSANVAGMLGPTRIALNDNLLKQCTLPEIRAVMAHEMGHYVLNHGAKLTIYFGIMALCGSGIASVAFDWARIANSIQRRSKNLFSSIIPAAAPGFKWRWIGKPRICPVEISTRRNQRQNDRSSAMNIPIEEQLDAYTTWKTPELFARYGI